MAKYGKVVIQKRNILHLEPSFYEFYFLLILYSANFMFYTSVSKVRFQYDGAQL